MTNKNITSEEIISKLKRERDVLIKYKVKKIGLFGSFVKGEQEKYSDIDFLVEFDLKQCGKNFKGLYDAFMGLSNYLEKAFGRKIELITNGSLSPYIEPYIKKDVKWYET